MTPGLTWAFALGCLGAFVSGAAKTGVPGLGILTAPIFALLLPARESVGVVLLILICADLLAVASYPRNTDWRTILRLAPWALAGIGAGWWGLQRLDEPSVRRLIGWILIPMVLLAIRRRWMGARGIEERPLPPAAAAPVGMVAGFTTMVANAAGPVMVLYLLAMRLDKARYLATSAWYFFCLNWIKVPFGITAGAITDQSLRQAAVFFPAAIAGGLVGRRIAKRIPQAAFESTALALTAVSALWLVVGADVLAWLRGR
ncbi:MAG: sulfite exporter TauE/SafE family protein [Armatimonadota bacterium]